MSDIRAMRLATDIGGPLTEPQRTTFVCAGFGATCDGAGNWWLSGIETKDPAP